MTDIRLDISVEWFFFFSFVSPKELLGWKLVDLKFKKHLKKGISFRFQRRHRFIAPSFRVLRPNYRWFACQSSLFSMKQRYFFCFAVLWNDVYTVNGVLVFASLCSNILFIFFFSPKTNFVAHIQCKFRTIFMKAIDSLGEFKLIGRI